MKGIVIYNKGTEEYARYAHSDQPEVTGVSIHQATVFWPDELEPGFEEELIEMTAMCMQADPETLEAKEVKVTIV